jgi:hypothetical protein
MIVPCFMCIWFTKPPHHDQNQNHISFCMCECTATWGPSTRNHKQWSSSASHVFRNMSPLLLICVWQLVHATCAITASASVSCFGVAFCLTFPLQPSVICNLAAFLGVVILLFQLHFNVYEKQHFIQKWSLALVHCLSSSIYSNACF